MPIDRYGTNGHDLFDGEGGAYRMFGLGGNDRYIVDIRDIGNVIEAPGEGDADEIFFYLTDNNPNTYTIPDNVENFILANPFPNQVITGVNITGNALNNTMYGTDLTNDTFSGGGGNDNVAGFGGNDILHGNAGTDSINGGDGTDDLYGDEGNDFMVGGTGYDRFYGGDGDDAMSDFFGSFAGSPHGGDRMEGGIGNDSYQVDSTEDVYIEAADAGTDSIQLYWTGTSFTIPANFENLFAESTGSTAGVLTLIGNAVANNISGNDRANIIYGGAGNDRLFGFGGTDTVYGEAGNDTLTGNDDDTLIGGADDDVYNINAPGVQVMEEAGGGFDTVFINFTGGTFRTGENIESITMIVQEATGTSTIIGGSNANTFNGNRQDNVFDGGAGDDSLFGNEGNDTLIGGLGADVINGGAGIDTVSYEDDFGAVFVNLTVARGFRQCGGWRYVQQHRECARVGVQRHDHRRRG